MSGALTKHNLFHASPARAATKADITDQIARDITAAETARRHAASARLKQLRQERDVLAQAAGETPPAGKKPAARARKPKAG